MRWARSALNQNGRGPTRRTAGDFCRRFETVEQIAALQRAIDEARQTVWAKQPDEFFEQATVDRDGHIVETTGESSAADVVFSYNARCNQENLIAQLSNGPSLHTQGCLRFPLR